MQLQATEALKVSTNTKTGRRLLARINQKGAAFLMALQKAQPGPAKFAGLSKLGAVGNGEKSAAGTALGTGKLAMLGEVQSALDLMAGSLDPVKLPRALQKTATSKINLPELRKALVAELKQLMQAQKAAAGKQKALSEPQAKGESQVLEGAVDALPLDVLRALLIKAKKAKIAATNTKVDPETGKQIKQKAQAGEVAQSGLPAALGKPGLSKGETKPTLSVAEGDAGAHAIKAAKSKLKPKPGRSIKLDNPAQGQPKGQGETPLDLPGKKSEGKEIGIKSALKTLGVVSQGVDGKQAGSKGGSGFDVKSDLLNAPEFESLPPVLKKVLKTLKTQPTVQAKAKQAVEAPVVQAQAAKGLPVASRPKGKPLSSNTEKPVEVQVKQGFEPVRNDAPKGTQQPKTPLDLVRDGMKPSKPNSAFEVPQAPNARPMEAAPAKEIPAKGKSAPKIAATDVPAGRPPEKSKPVLEKKDQGKGGGKPIEGLAAVKESKSGRPPVVENMAPKDAGDLPTEQIKPNRPQAVKPAIAQEPSLGRPMDVVPKTTGAMPEPAGGPQTADLKPTEAVQKPVQNQSQTQKPIHRQIEHAMRQAYIVRPRAVSVRIHPEELGEVRIQVVAESADKMKAKIEAENQRVAAVIKDAQNDLEYRLREQGIDLDQLEITEREQKEEKREEQGNQTDAEGNTDEQRQKRAQNGQTNASGDTSATGEAGEGEHPEVQPEHRAAESISEGQPFSFTV